MNTSTNVPSNSTTRPPKISHEIRTIFWILIGGGALLFIVVVVVIVIKFTSAQRKKTLQDGSKSQASQLQETSVFTNTVPTDSA